MSNVQLSALEREIRNHERVIKHDQLKVEQWSKSAFDLCAQIVHQFLSESLSPKEARQLGTTISYKTLQSIFKGEYRIKYPLDPRSLNTLNKLVRFVGFSDWDAFVVFAHENQDRSQFEERDHLQLVQQVRQAIRTSFDAFYQMNLTKELAQYFDTSSSAYFLIAEVIDKHRKLNNVISNPYNPSTFEITSIDLNQIDRAEASVKTQEYWLLCWWNRDTQKYVKRFKDLQEHQYILHRKNNQWKIRSDITLSDKYE